ncbi:hypothetical protein [Desulfobacula toluolica]|uniref:Conserved uncharacterized protein n=1 Tax=Desulfobacula toluolica (strain DSM 7467 / Tol2) TaxID=651182 RepID=K0NIQ4_DESTT|nr:hypothetical protein [Desulfobacula toluolica]CCK80810.1 conserved uncharacterized protein [Desulfobacula toluolica Tol2]
MNKKNVIWGLSILLIGVGLSLTHDIIITNFLAWRICKTEPNPKTFIKKTVEFPGSVYWEDNIYPGFDESDRVLMIRNYLDGVHLTTMALNSPGGKIYLYTATETDWQTSKDIHNKFKKGNYYDTMDEEARLIVSRGKVISKQELPLINYKVVFNPVELTPFQRRYLYSDEVIIMENRTNEVIAYNRRLMRKFYILVPDFVGGRRYFPSAMCGESGSVDGFDGIVLTKYCKFISAKHAGKYIK